MNFQIDSEFESFMTETVSLEFGLAFRLFGIWRLTEVEAFHSS